MTNSGFEPFRRKMLQAALPQVAIDTFARYYALVRDGETGLVSRDNIQPVETVPEFSSLTDYRAAGDQALSRLALIKLNGGLGTSMGMRKAKSLLAVKENLSFLDITARQVLRIRAAHDCRLPLLLMNSFHTRDDTLAALAAYPSLAEAGLELDFAQHKVPRICVDTFAPLAWPGNPALEWCPPGHGDVYAALRTSGMLDKLLQQGYEYAFISNADNLGAVVDSRILGWVASENLSFVMEVAKRTASDKKGGHLACLVNGGLTLRESAQCPADEIDEFQNIDKYRFFNTNNLWLNLEALDKALRECANIFPLPMIRNEKHVVATDASTPRVYQTETAMGAAISLFDDARALLVPRQRFLPIKTTNDLLKLWSDLYTLSEDFEVLAVDSHSGDVVVDLDPRFYRAIDDFTDRFANGAPSLGQASRLSVKGDVKFERDVVVLGDVLVDNPTLAQMTIEHGSILD